MLCRKPPASCGVSDVFFLAGWMCVRKSIAMFLQRVVENGSDSKTILSWFLRMTQYRVWWWQGLDFLSVLCRMFLVEAPVIGMGHDYHGIAQQVRHRMGTSRGCWMEIWMLRHFPNIVSVCKI